MLFGTLKTNKIQKQNPDFLKTTVCTIFHYLLPDTTLTESIWKAHKCRDWLKWSQSVAQWIHITTSVFSGRWYLLGPLGLGLSNRSGGGIGVCAINILYWGVLGVQFFFPEIRLLPGKVKQGSGNVTDERSLEFPPQRSVCVLWSHLWWSVSGAGEHQWVSLFGWPLGHFNCGLQGTEETA